jgi:hypothetical protein
MPAAAAQVSTLADVLRLAQAVFSLMGDGTPLLVGEQYLTETGPGSAPRVVFVPDKDGKFAPALKINAGYIASWSHGCRVHVLGSDPGDDPGRFEPVYVLAARVTAVLKNLSPARIVLAPGNPKDDSPLGVGATAGIAFSFTFQADLAQEPEVLRAIAQITSSSPPNPDKPGGDTGKTFSVSAAPTAERP